ncbi:hypothetical protein [Flavobacterium sp.]|uniref:hypothetical protein n=1 Tax=Flavobacterium sp. TaxID=239 RepID=UPI0040476D3D
MKNKIFNFLKKHFRVQLISFCIENFPLNITTEKMILEHKIVLVKKGKIREWRMYDSNHKRIYNFERLDNGKIIINY